VATVVYVVVYFACPFDKETVAKIVVPCLKVTDPLTAPANWPVTVAVKVTDCFRYEGFGVEVRAIAVVALFTFCGNADELLGLKFESPL
jgi:hypothetical protein